MPKIKTTRGTLVNNTGAHKITDDNATIFNFCIDDVTLADGTLTVSCTTLAGDEIEYTLDISKDTKALPTALENLNVAGDVNLFLALAYRIYESGLEPSEDMPSGDCTELQERINELEAIVPEGLNYVSVGYNLDLSVLKVGGVSEWQNNEDKSTIQLTGLTIWLYAYTKYIREDYLYYAPIVTCNNTNIPMSDSITALGTNPHIGNDGDIPEISVGDDHQLNFEITYQIPQYTLMQIEEEGIRGQYYEMSEEPVTLPPIHRTLNLDTLEWTPMGGGEKPLN